MLHRSVIALIVILGLLHIAVGCKREPSTQHGPKRTGDNGYRIVVGDDEQKYQPGKIYNGNVICGGEQKKNKLILIYFIVHLLAETEQDHFTAFKMGARSASSADDKTARYATASPKRVGRFQLFNDELTQFNLDCVNTISEVDHTPKADVQVMWVAPATGSGCVALWAMVSESPNSWYADDGQLTRVICEATPERVIADACCACDEASYNVNQSIIRCIDIRLIL